MPTFEDRIRGGVLGLLVGDMVGVPYEFHAAHEIPPRELIEPAPPAGFVRSAPGAPPGAWSDDGAQALCLLACLLERGRLDPDDLARRIVAWRRSGYMAVDGNVFDCGIATDEAIRNLEAGVPALEAGPAREMSNGNGSLMRVLPLALWHRGSDAELADDAQTQSRVTHGHLRSQLCCALHCLWARRVLQGHSEAWLDAVDTLRRLRASDRLALAELEGPIRAGDAPGGKGSGYVVDCLHSARAAVGAGPYVDVVRAAIALGDDTDTTAAVAGGIAGVRDGASAIPSRWLDALRGRELVDPLLNALVERLA